ncbi:hypothetical protein DIPPA_23544 [Diplonema papillatum]|nr:hypothetical protein DIPPA_23544 [Diplonema papillatum]
MDTPPSEDPGRLRRGTLDAVWSEMCENLTRFVFKSTVTGAPDVRTLDGQDVTGESGERLFAWGKYGPALRDSAWIQVAIGVQLAETETNPLDPALVARLLGCSEKRVMYDAGERRLYVELPSGSNHGAAQPSSAAEQLVRKLAADVNKGTAGVVGGKGVNVASVALHAVHTDTASTVYRLPAWRRRCAASGPSLEFEEGLIIREERDLFVSDLYLSKTADKDGTRRRALPVFEVARTEMCPLPLPSASEVEEVRAKRNRFVDDALTFSTVEIRELLEKARRRFAKYAVAGSSKQAGAKDFDPSPSADKPSDSSSLDTLQRVPTPPGTSPEVEGLHASETLGRTLTSMTFPSSQLSQLGSTKPAKHAAALEQEMNLLFQDPAKRKAALRLRQAAFTAVSDAVANERSRRLRVLAVAAPKKGNRASVPGVRTDYAVVHRKQMLYSKASFNAGLTQDIQRVLHRSAFAIAPPGATAASLTQNANLLRPQKPLTKISESAWDPYCCVRSSALPHCVMGLTKYAC